MQQVTAGADDASRGRHAEAARAHAGPAFEEPCLLQMAQRLANRRPADAELATQRLLGRGRRIVRPVARLESHSENLGDLLMQRSVGPAHLYSFHDSHTI